MSDIGQTLRSLRNGRAEEEFLESLRSLVEAVRLTGKAGSVALVLKVKPASRGDTEVLQVEDAITLKLPQPERGQTIMFATDDNQLQRQDPRQPELDGLREAPAQPSGKLREVR